VSGFTLPLCSGNPAQASRINIRIGGVPTYAMVALPSGPPKGIVVYGHGYSEWASESLDKAQIEAFAAQGAIAIAPDYRGTVDPADTNDDTQNSQGAPIAAGAQDMAVLAQAALAQCPVPVVISAGGSMGGTISGLAVTLRARRPNGQPLFDYWVGISPLANLATEYVEADALAPANSYYGVVASNMRTEAGGSPAQVPMAYLARSLLVRVGDMAAAGLKGAGIFMSAADFDVSADQEVTLAGELAAQRVPTQVFVDTVAAPGEDDASFDNEVFDLLYAVNHEIVIPEILAGHQGPYLRTAADVAVGQMLANRWVGTLGVSAVAGPLP
jgi:acetyl esterase/lipase